MNHILSLEAAGLQSLHSQIFPSIASGNTILFLGAGASVTDREFLSKRIITLYSDRMGIKLDTDDIVDFVDTLSSSPTFDRNEFDEIVSDWLRKLSVLDTHKIIASLRWKEIITTNFDTLVEQAFDVVRNTADENLRLRGVKSISEYSYYPANDEVRYVKLNGCVSDVRRHPLILSSKDFENSNKFHKMVLKSLENLSHKIQFLSVGFSYSDPFARTLLERFNKQNFRAGKWMVNVDSFVQDARLPYFSDQRICVIKCTAEEFFMEYKKWELAHQESVLGLSSIKIRNRLNQNISIAPKVLLRVRDDLLPLSDYVLVPAIKANDFYRGEQPSYDVVRKGIDVVKRRLLESVSARIKAAAITKTPLVPVLLLTGSYGTGKTTFCYRVVFELVHDEEFRAAAFEVIDCKNLAAVDLGEVFNKLEAENIILFANGIEVDSSFKSLMELRNRLSVEQFSDFNIIILASIRENILDRHKANSSYASMDEVKADVPLNEEEATDLLEKLSQAGVVDYRDVKERNQLSMRIVKEFGGDTLTALTSLVADGHHSFIIHDAYNQLSKVAQQAFLFTSLLHRFGIRIPSGVLRAVTSKDWDDFIRDVLKFDCRGMLIQEYRNREGTDPDLYLRTRHPVLAEAFVKEILPNEDERFDKYRELLQHVFASNHNSKLVIDLMKALRFNNDLSQDKINKLFDICSQEFGEDPNFTLHYAINLQYRHDEGSLLKAVKKISYAESFTEVRNHRLIHRRAVLNFELAKVKHSLEQLELKETYQYIHEAREYFTIKQALDPFSSFSYRDVLEFEIWCLEKLNMNEVERVKQMVLIENMFSKAKKSLFENQHLIAETFESYVERVNPVTSYSRDQFFEYIDDLHKREETKPYALIMEFNYFERIGDSDECISVIKELENYTYLDEVVKVLFRYYSYNLHFPNIRTRFFGMLKNNPFLEQVEPLNFYYGIAIAEAYSRHWGDSFDCFAKLRSKYHHLNPFIRESWRDSETGERKTFDGSVVLSKSRKRIKISELQQVFDIKPSDRNAGELGVGSFHKVHLDFSLTGIRAELATKSGTN